MFGRGNPTDSTLSYWVSGKSRAHRKVGLAPMCFARNALPFQTIGPVFSPVRLSAGNSASVGNSRPEGNEIAGLSTYQISMAAKS